MWKASVARLVRSEMPTIAYEGDEADSAIERALSANGSDAHVIVRRVPNCRAARFRGACVDAKRAHHQARVIQGGAAVHSDLGTIKPLQTRPGARLGAIRYDI